MTSVAFRISDQKIYGLKVGYMCVKQFPEDYAHIFAKTDKLTNKLDKISAVFLGGLFGA